MSGQSTSMQMESLVDALLSDERVLTASERALLASILQIATSPTDSPQIDALVASRVMAAIGTERFSTCSRGLKPGIRSTLDRAIDSASADECGPDHPGSFFSSAPIVADRCWR